LRSLRRSFSYASVATPFWRRASTSVLNRPSRVRLLGAFSLKVGLEAIRDVVLIPLALLAGLAGLLLSPAAPDRFFREVLRLGARFDDFLDLFGVAARTAPPLALGAARVDDLVDGIEAVLREQHQRGGVTASAKTAIDRALDAVEGALHERPPPPSRSS
jgi:hypothetical protein